jgi:acyl-coenzyme A thioesterase PaaI-like protein
MGREVSHYVGVTMREVDDLVIVGRAPVAPHLCGPSGTIRSGVLLTMLDNVGGLNGGLAALPDGWVVSTNLAARVVSAASRGPLHLESRVLRRGRNSVVTEVAIRDSGADDTLVASGVLTSAILVPENGPPRWERPVELDTLDGAREPKPSLPEWLGARAIDDRTLEIDLADDLRNPWGILHGGVVASLVDLTAEHATGGGRTTDVLLHYLAPNRIGPVRASACVLGRRSDGDVVRVEVRDEGASRPTAVAIATCATPD